MIPKRALTRSYYAEDVEFDKKLLNNIDVQKIKANT